MKKVIPTRADLREGVAFKKIRLSDKTKRALLDELGFTDEDDTSKGEFEPIFRWIEKVLGEHFVARIGLDKKPRPSHRRLRAAQIATLAAKLRNVLKEADQYTLSEIRQAGFGERRAFAGWPIEDPFERLSIDLDELLRRLSLLASSSTTVVKKNSESGRKGQTVSAKRVLAARLGQIYDHHHENGDLTPAEIRKLKVRFIRLSASAAHIKLAKTFDRLLS